jgi:hypothetical protein
VRRFDKASHRGCGARGVATSDDVVPAQVASEGPAHGTKQTNRLGDPLRGRMSAVQDSYYQVVPCASTMA